MLKLLCDLILSSSECSVGCERDEEEKEDQDREDAQVCEKIITCQFLRQRERERFSDNCLIRQDGEKVVCYFLALCQTLCIIIMCCRFVSVVCVHRFKVI